MKIVSYYTPLYEEEAQTLIKSLEKFKLKYSVEKLPCLGSWAANCRQKIPYILKHLKEGPIFWTDADSVIQQYPSLIFDLDCDMALHNFKDKEYQGGTMYFNNTVKTISFVKRWIEYLNSDQYLKSPGRKGDQSALNDLLNKPNDLIIKPLPPEYCFIFDLSKQYYGNFNPVIEHFQASRKFKTIVGRK